MGSPNILAIAADPKFQALPELDQHAILGQFDPNFAALPDADKPQVLDALQKHALTRPDLVAPPGIQRPQAPNMQESAAAQMFLPQQNPQAPPPSKVPPSIQNAPDWVGEAIGGATLGGLAALGGAQIPGGGMVGRFLARTAGAAVKAAPWIAASEAINYARQAIPGGKYIPPGAELLPLFMAGQGKAAEGEAAAKPAKNAGDPFRNVPDPEADVFREPAPTPAAAEAEAAATGEATAEQTANAFQTQNAPYTYSGESALRQVLTGLGNKDLLQVARSRGVNVTAEAQLKPGVADNRIIGKIIDDFSPEELDDFRDTYLEATRQGRPSGVGPEAYTTKVLQQFFPDLKIPQTRLVRTQKAFGRLTDLARQPQ